jgi:hypothetical protein
MSISQRKIGPPPASILQSLFTGGQTVLVRDIRRNELVVHVLDQPMYQFRSWFHESSSALQMGVERQSQTSREVTYICFMLSAADRRPLCAWKKTIVLRGIAYLYSKECLSYRSSCEAYRR